MSIVAPELLMLGTSTASAACCIAVPERAKGRSLALAAIMVLLMGAMAVGAAAWLQYAGSAVVAALAVSLVLAASAGLERDAAYHRALGTALMVLFVLVHLHIPGNGGGHIPVSGGGHMGHPMHHPEAVPLHDTMMLHVLQIGAVAYAAWAAVGIRRMRHAPGTAWVRREHVAMTASVLVMAFWMS